LRDTSSESEITIETTGEAEIRGLLTVIQENLVHQKDLHQRRPPTMVGQTKTEPRSRETQSKDWSVSTMLVAKREAI